MIKIPENCKPVVNPVAGVLKQADSSDHMCTFRCCSLNSPPPSHLSPLTFPSRDIIRNPDEIIILSVHCHIWQASFNIDSSDSLSSSMSARHPESFPQMSWPGGGRTLLSGEVGVFPMTLVPFSIHARTHIFTCERNSSPYTKQIISGGTVQPR